MIIEPIRPPGGPQKQKKLFSIKLYHLCAKLFYPFLLITLLLCAPRMRRFVLILSIQEAQFTLVYFSLVQCVYCIVYLHISYTHKHTNTQTHKHTQTHTNSRTHYMHMHILNINMCMHICIHIYCNIMYIYTSHNPINTRRHDDYFQEKLIMFF